MIHDLRFKIILHSGLIGLFVYLFIGLFLPTASGQTMSNQNYIIQTQGIDTTANVNKVTNDPTSPRLRGASQRPTTNDQHDPSVSEGVNFKVKTGFEGIRSSLPFSISLSSDIVDFGELSPTNPIVRTVDLSVSNISPYGYSVVAYENHSLQKDDASIPNTTCDNGQCNQANAAEWTNVLTYGFGYRCDNLSNNDCDIAFAQPNFYKHFSDNSNSQYPQSVISGIGSGNRSARLSYKVNISGNQAQGIYNNIISYIAIPNF